MADVLEVGALIDTSQIIPGLQSIATQTAQTTSQMTANMGQLAAASQADTQAMIVALTELRSSLDANTIAVEDMSASVSASMARMASGVRAGAEEAGLSLRELSREFGEVAEAAELSAVGAVSAFGPLGAIFGVGLAAHFLEKLKEVTLQMGRLSDLTGVSVQRLAEFRGAMEEMGVPTENMSRLLVHLDTTMLHAAEGSKSAAESFKQLGIDSTGWSKQLPDTLDVLLKMSDHLHDFKGSALDAAAAGQILGQRLGVELAGALTVGSEAIRERMKAHAALGEAMEKARADAQRLQEVEAQLAAQIQEVGLTVLPFLVDFITTTRTLFTALWADITDILAIIQAALYSIGTSIEGTAVVIAKALTFDFTGARASMQAYANDISNMWKAVGDKITTENASIQNALNQITAPPRPVGAGRGLLDDTSQFTAGAKSRVEVWKEALETMKADADNFHTVTLTDEVNYWQNIIATQKLSVKEQMEVQRELNRAKHAAALEAFRDQIALDEEFVKAARVGSAERLAAVQAEADLTTEKYGAASKEAIAANRKVLDEQIAGDKQMAADVAKTVNQQVEDYARGSEKRIEITAAGIAQLKVMQDNLAAGKTALGAVEPPAPVGPSPQADAALRVLVRRTESDDIQRIIDVLTARLAEDYRAETAEVYKQALEQEKIRIEAVSRVAGEGALLVDASKRTTDELISLARVEATEAATSSKRTTDERIKEIEKLQSYDLISFNQKIALIRAALTQEEAAATAEFTSKVNAIKAEELSTQVTIQSEKIKQSAIIGTAAAQEAADDAMKRSAELANAKIADLTKQQEKFYQDLATRRMQLDDEATNHEIQQAATAASVISSSFEGAFDRMTTTHTTFTKTMIKFWDDMVVGFEKMGIKIVADWIKRQAEMAIATALGQAQQTAAASAGAASRQVVTVTETGVHITNESIKAGATAVGQTSQTGSVTAGAIARRIITVAETVFHTIQEGIRTTATVTGQIARTAAHLAGSIARMIIGGTETVFHVVQENIKVVATVVGQAVQTAAVIAGAAARTAVLIASSLASILIAAGVAAAHAFKSVMEVLPFPINIAVAGGVAAAVFGIVKGFASAAGGVEVGRGQQGLPVLVHSGEVITHASTIDTLSRGGSGPAVGMKISSDKLVMLQEGAVVVPASQAPGLATAILGAGGSIGEMPGISKPAGIQEIPQRLSSNTSSVIKEITDRSTSEGKVGVTASLEALTVPAAASGLDRIIAARGFERTFSARGGLDSRTTRILSAAGGVNVSRYHSSRSGFDRSFFSAAGGLDTSRIYSSASGYASSAHVVSAAGGLDLSRGGLDTTRVYSAAGGIETTLRGLGVAPAVVSAAGGFEVPGGFRELGLTSLPEKVSNVPAVAARGIFSTTVGAGLTTVPLGAGGTLAAPVGLTRTFGSTATGGTAISNDNRSLTVRPEITITHQELSPGTTHDDIINAVKRAVRAGSLSVFS